MKHLTIKMQLTLAFATLVGALMLIGSIALYNQSALNNRFSGYVEGIEARGTLVVDVRVQANRRALGVRDMTLVKTDADRASAKEMAVKANETLHASLQALQAAAAAAPDLSDRERSLLSTLNDIEAQYEPVALAIVNLADTGRRDDAIDKIDNECRPLLAKLLTATADYMAYTREVGAEAVKTTAEAYQVQRTWLIALSAVTVAAALALGWLITRRLTSELGAEPAILSDIAQNVARGDLRPVIGVEAAPAGSVLASMGTMQAQLVNLIDQVRASANSISSASTEIAQGNSDLSSRTESQASSLEETASSMDELSSSVQHNADNAKHADQLAQSARDVALQGGQLVDQVVETMRGIATSSKRIADIISVIDEIAFQTNLLALNAAVEAARAGEQGRGFAVVASEVRALAGRSAQAAKEIKDLIQDSVTRVETGSGLVDRAGTTMTEIVEAIKRVTDLVGDISGASAEQASGVGQVGQAVTAMDQTTQQNAALVEQGAAAAEELRHQAQQLVAAIAVFKLVQDSSIANERIVASTKRPASQPQVSASSQNVVRPHFGAARPTAGGSTRQRTGEPSTSSRTGTDWSEF